MPALRLLPAAALLLAGCVAPDSSAPSAPPVALGSDTTPWGVLPRYEQGRMKPSSRFSPRGAPPPGKVIADVLVERGGQVRDVKIVEADGAPGATRAAYALIRASVYAPLPPDGPELYVVRQTIQIKASTRSSISSAGMTNDGGGNSTMPANQTPPPVYSR